MSATIKIPHTIVFRHPDAHPPVLLAGSFTTPAWLEQDMEASVDDHGERVFKAIVLVEPGRDHHFRFKVGSTTDAWIVDESKPVAEDETGRKTNLMKVPLEQQARTQSKDLFFAEIADPIDSIESYTYTRDEGTATADVAEDIEFDETSPPQASASGGESETEDDLRTPLFAHECLGAYAFVDDGLDHDSIESHSRRDSRPKSLDHKLDQPDLNDPTLEKFPSNRSSVLDTLRKIQSSLGEDRVQVDGLNHRRGSADSDDSVCSAGSSGPSTTTTARKRDHRMSAGGRNRSLASLGSIAE